MARYCEAYSVFLSTRSWLTLNSVLSSLADLDQMNVYLNYCREHEMMPDDNLLVVLILCAQK